MIQPKKQRWECPHCGRVSDKLSVKARLARRKAISEAVYGDGGTPVKVELIANSFGCTLSMVYTSCREFGVNTKPVKRVDMLTILSASMSRDEGTTAVSVSESLEISKHNVWNVYKDARLAGIDVPVLLEKHRNTR